MLTTRKILGQFFCRFCKKKKNEREARGPCAMERMSNANLLLSSASDHEWTLLYVYYLMFFFIYLFCPPLRILGYIHSYIEFWSWLGKLFKKFKDLEQKFITSLSERFVHWTCVHSKICRTPCCFRESRWAHINVKLHFFIFTAVCIYYLMLFFFFCPPDRILG